MTDQEDPADLPTSMDELDAYVAGVWERLRPRVEARIDRLDVVVAQATEDGLPEELREEASDEAHRLAGSLGSYGFPGGSQAARELELLLNAEPPAAADELDAAVARLRDELSM